MMDLMDFNGWFWMWLTGWGFFFASSVNTEKLKIHDFAPGTSDHIEVSDTKAVNQQPDCCF